MASARKNNKFKLFLPTMDLNKILFIIANALVEDVGEGDHTSLATIPEEQTSIANVIYKDNGLIAGIEFAKILKNFADPSIKIKEYAADGDYIEKGNIVMQLQGNTRSLLKIERLLLNVMQRMSGIASTTNEAVKKIKHTKAKLLDTRKTTPLLRVLEKWATKIGGAENHRFGLYDQIMIKDNHIKANNSIEQTIKKVEEYLKKINKKIPVIVEVKNLEELEIALKHEIITRILLDNMNTEALRQAVKITANKKPLEASGGITLKNIKEVAETGVDYISVGFITHSYKAKDISMKLI